uniref:Uncharacterized protein n=1 Tax=Bionectria ochroleuca TaxID=29856 RepID=A0A8H7KDV8_BIOOC
MAPLKREEDSLPCSSWMFSTGTNVHVAKDRSWFADDYKPFETFVESRLGVRLPVIGIGTANLATKTAANKTGPASHGTLRLEFVLHVPRALWNIVGTPIYDDYDYLLTRRVFTDEATGRQVAYCKPGTMLCEIQLSRPPIGPKQQLRRIKDEYGSSANFMFSYGLKLYKDEDCEEA